MIASVSSAAREKRGGFTSRDGARAPGSPGWCGLEPLATSSTRIPEESGGYFARRRASTSRTWARLRRPAADAPSLWDRLGGNEEEALQDRGGTRKIGPGSGGSVSASEAGCSSSSTLIGSPDACGPVGGSAAGGGSLARRRILLRCLFHFRRTYATHASPSGVRRHATYASRAWRASRLGTGPCGVSGRTHDGGIGVAECRPCRDAFPSGIAALGEVRPIGGHRFRDRHVVLRRLRVGGIEMLETFARPRRALRRTRPAVNRPRIPGAGRRSSRRPLDLPVFAWSGAQIQVCQPNAASRVGRVRSSDRPGAGRVGLRRLSANGSWRAFTAETSSA